MNRHPLLQTIFCILILVCALLLANGCSRNDPLSSLPDQPIANTTEISNVPIESPVHLTLSGSLLRNSTSVEASVNTPVPFTLIVMGGSCQFSVVIQNGNANIPNPDLDCDNTNASAVITFNVNLSSPANGFVLRAEITDRVTHLTKIISSDPFNLVAVQQDAPPTCTVNASNLSVVVGTTITATLYPSGVVTQRILNGTQLGSSNSVSITMQSAGNHAIQGIVVGPGGQTTCSVIINVTSPYEPPRPYPIIMANGHYYGYNSSNWGANVESPPASLPSGTIAITETIAAEQWDPLGISPVYTCYLNYNDGGTNMDLIWNRYASGSNFYLNTTTRPPGSSVCAICEKFNGSNHSEFCMSFY